MGKKGFVFVETIVVTVVLTVALITIYATFNSVLTNEKKHMAYDDTGYMYRTFYVQNFLANLNIKGYINNYFSDNSILIKQLYCNDVSLYHDNEEMHSMSVVCEKLINIPETLDIKNVYITRYDLSNLKNCIYNNCSDANLKKNIENLDLAFINYIKSLKPNQFYNDKYRLIIEYEESEYDYSNYMKPKNSTCQADYELINGKCIRDVHKFYFDNIIINTGGFHG